VSVLHFVSLYRLRVPLTAGNMLSSVFAAMSVQWTVARAVGFALVKDHLPFVRTAKGSGQQRRGGDFKAFWEAVIAALLLAGAATLVMTNYKEIREINLFAAVLVVQSIPFISAVLIALVERSRFNDFAYWRGLEAQVLDLLPKRAAIAKAPATESQKELVP
jgi:drug/metabolite transporter (DMT)-like permease